MKLWVKAPPFVQKNGEPKTSYLYRPSDGWQNLHYSSDLYGGTTAVDMTHQFQRRQAGPRFEEPLPVGTVWETCLR